MKKIIFLLLIATAASCAKDNGDTPVVTPETETTYAIVANMQYYLAEKDGVEVERKLINKQTYPNKSASPYEITYISPDIYEKSRFERTDDNDYLFDPESRFKFFVPHDIQNGTVLTGLNQWPYLETKTITRSDKDPENSHRVEAKSTFTVLPGQSVTVEVYATIYKFTVSYRAELKEHMFAAGHEITGKWYGEIFRERETIVTTDK